MIWLIYNSYSKPDKFQMKIWQPEYGTLKKNWFKLKKILENSVVSRWVTYHKLMLHKYITMKPNQNRLMMFMYQFLNRIWRR